MRTITQPSAFAAPVSPAPDSVSKVALSIGACTREAGESFMLHASSVPQCRV